MFAANVRNDHLPMFNFHLLLAVFSFSVDLSSLAVASKVRIILNYSSLYMYTNFFKKT